MFGPFDLNYDIESKPALLAESLDQQSLALRLGISTENLGRITSCIADEKQYVTLDADFLTSNELQDKKRFDELRNLYYFMVDLLNEISEKKLTDAQLKDIEQLLDEIAMRPDLLSERFSIIH